MPVNSPTSTIRVPERELDSNEAENEGINVASGNKDSSEFMYKLMGVVVHSGQASGGHYNSYIQCRQRDPLSSANPASSSASKWFKFDDGDVSELQVIDDDDESVNELLKNQWFGGDSTVTPGSSGGGGDTSTSFSFEQSSNFNRRSSSCKSNFLVSY